MKKNYLCLLAKISFLYKHISSSINIHFPGPKKKKKDVNYLIFQYVSGKLYRINLKNKQNCEEYFIIRITTFVYFYN